MWTNAAVACLTVIAIHTQNLKAGRVVVSREPLVKLAPIKRFPMGGAIVVHVIKR
jgi:hypothetical protein